MATTILGVDPGSQVTGLGLVRDDRPRASCVLAECVRPPRNAPLADRIHLIHTRVAEVIAENQPDWVVVETAFYQKNVRSTLVLGHVRGVILLAARQAGCRVEEYAPREIKMAVTGAGNAAKEQVGFMVRGLLGLREPLALDASDALAAALCHLHRGRSPEGLAREAAKANGSARSLEARARAALRDRATGSR